MSSFFKGDFLVGIVLITASVHSDLHVAWMLFLGCNWTEFDYTMMTFLYALETIELDSYLHNGHYNQWNFLRPPPLLFGVAKQRGDFSKGGYLKNFH